VENNNGFDKKMSDSVYSNKFRAGKRRTYFFDVRATRGNDYYITLTESTKRQDGDGYDRHKIFLYKEDFNEFLAMLTQTVDHVKTELMPQYDYDEFARRREDAQKEWELKKAAEADGTYIPEAQATDTPSAPIPPAPSTDDHADVDKW
jgi:hypothetical protein